MTKEEAIKSFEEDNRTMLENKTAYINELKARGMEFEDRMVSYIDESVERNELAISALKDEWIPVSERLPEIHQVVLLSLRSLDIEVGFRAETEPYFYCHGVDGCYVEPQNVLAWQSLPEPYKKGE